MKIAIFLTDENFELIDHAVRQLYAFKIENEVITSIGYRTLSVNNVHYILLWLINKEIDTVYMDHADPVLNVYLEKLKITVKPLAAIKDNPLLELFLHKPENNG